MNKFLWSIRKTKIKILHTHFVLYCNWNQNHSTEHNGWMDGWIDWWMFDIHCTCSLENKMKAHKIQYFHFSMRENWTSIKIVQTHCCNNCWLKNRKHGSNQINIFLRGKTHKNRRTSLRAHEKFILWPWVTSIPVWHAHFVCTTANRTKSNDFTNLDSFFFLSSSVYQKSHNVIWSFQLF